MRSILLAVLALIALPARAREPQVIINEIMYHPPGERDGLQYIELFNLGNTPVDLSGWALAKGVRFVFPPRTTLAGGSYLVICRDRADFAAHYGITAQHGESDFTIGDFQGSLSHGGETVELADARGELVESVPFSDAKPWPQGADGTSASLERICPLAPPNVPENWAASILPRARRPAGSPGRKNDNHAPGLPPVISDVQFAIPAPENKTTVTAMVGAAGGVESVFVLSSCPYPGKQTAEARVAMERVSGDAQRGRYRAVLDGRPEGSLIRFRIQAVDSKGVQRFEPPENEPSPTYSYFTSAAVHSASVPIAQVLPVGPPQGESRRWSTRKETEEIPTGGNGAFVYHPAGGGPPELFDHVRIALRHGGFKVRFQKDRPLKGITVANFLSEEAARWTLSEPLSYELYRLAGVPAPLTDHVRIWYDGRLVGYHLLVEQPNRAFLVRNGRSASGNLYKAQWFGRGVVGQHEKKTNPTTGHQDLLDLIEGLKSANGDEGWAFIQKQFNVEEVAGYYAVCMCISDWDGFHNNHFVFHAPGRGGKWEVYPWDKDKTWGDYDSASRKYDWYEMPLTTGMEGDRSPPLDPSSKGNNRRGDFGGVSWWRKGGYLSRPLLANSRFRERLFARLDELCSSAFTEDRLFPYIDAMEKRLEEEVRLRAEVAGDDPREALRTFKSNIQSLRNQVRHRRTFILAELAKAKQAQKP